MAEGNNSIFLDKSTNVPEPHVYLMGNFDGVHRGHMSLIEQAKNLSRNKSVPLGAIIFHPHPRDFFSSAEGSGKRLTPTPQKVELLHQAGIKTIVIIPFSQNIADMDGEDFLSLLFAHLTLTHIVVGEDFCFGKNRKNTSADIKNWGRTKNISVTTVPLLGKGEPFSSRRIIELLQKRELLEANTILGRPYFLQGPVVRGDGRGRQLGFPTANISCSSFFLPARGVYAVTAQLRGKSLKGVANIGTRPTFNQTQDVVEVHLFEWHEDFYGETLVISLQYPMRPDQRFASALDLANQIQKDCLLAQQLLTD